jgi:hypothetical protein
MLNALVLVLLAAAVAGIWRTNATLATIRADIAYMKETIALHARRLDVIEHDDARRSN